MSSTTTSRPHREEHHHQYGPICDMCHLCNSNTKEHRCEECPQRHNVTHLCHGTKIDDLKNTTLTTLCNSGRLGPGLYLTTPSMAETIANSSHRQGSCAAVFHLECNLGTICPVPVGSGLFQFHYHCPLLTIRPP